MFHQAEFLEPLKVGYAEMARQPVHISHGKPDLALDPATAPALLTFHGHAPGASPLKLKGSP
jgi:hypothetical protein